MPIYQYINNKRKNAHNILQQCSDRHGFVDWRNASTFTSRLIGEVISQMKEFTSDAEEAKTVFDLSLYVCRLFADTSIDDSGGETQYFTDACIELWDYIVENTGSRDFHEYILDELINICDEIGRGEYMADEIDIFISTHFNDEGFASPCLPTTRPTPPPPPYTAEHSPASFPCGNPSLMSAKKSVG